MTVEVEKISVTRDQLRQAAQDEHDRDPMAFERRFGCGIASYLETVDECFAVLPAGARLELSL